MGALTRDGILAHATLARETVDVPEWGGPVLVQELTAAQRDAFEASCVGKRGKTVTPDLSNLRAKLVIRVVVDEAGNRVFQDADAEAIGALSATAVNRVFEVGLRLSGMTPGDVEELAKNSAGEPSAASSSGSPETSAAPTSTDSPTE